MDKRLGRFELLEQIEVGGYTTVYRAVEDVGEGISRPAAVKVLQAWNLDDQEQLARLRREAGMLVDIGEAPNIVSVHGIGIDPEMGPWIAMELAGRSLKYAIEDGPAEPSQVRVLLRDVLHALQWVHSVEPPILHRDLKPQNILSTGPGLWKVADFGLAKRAGAEETMQLATVKYAAPELLDSTLGGETPKVDIYALGMIAYEMALGRTLFRKQFPSVYDPARGSKESDEDDRPKWMYWHTSMQMTLPPLAELIEGYPKDLSDLVAAMTTKSAPERIATAEDALERLGEVSATLPAMPPQEGDEKEKRDRAVSPVIAGAALVAVLVAAVAGLMWLFVQGQPRIEFDGEPRFVGNTNQIPVACRIVNPPSDGTVQVSLGRSGANAFELERVGNSDRWAGTVRLDSITEVEGALAIFRGRERLVRRRVEIVRTPPDSVEVTFRATRDGRESSPIEGALVQLTSVDRLEVHFEGRTNERGEVVAQVPFGPFLIAAEHPKFLPFDNTGSRGTPEPIRPKADGTSRFVIPFEPRSFAEIRQRMSRLVDDLLRLARLQTDCPDGEPLITQAQRGLITKFCAELRALGDGNPSVLEFVARIEAVEDCDPTSVPPAPPLPVDPELASADPIARIAQLTTEIEYLTWVKVNCTDPPNPEISEQDEALRQRMLDDLQALLRLTGRADLETLDWIQKMRSVDDCDPSSVPERPAVLDEAVRMAESGTTADAARAAAGASDAVADAADVGGDGTDGSSGTDGAGGGDGSSGRDGADAEFDVEAFMRDFESKYGPIGGGAGADGSANGEAGTARERNAQGGRTKADTKRDALTSAPPDFELMADLRAMSLADFRAYVESRVPRGAITVTDLALRDDLRLEGPLFNDQELFTLYVRLREAILIERIEDELRIGGWELARRLQDDLTSIDAAGPRVDAYFNAADPTLFAQFLAGSADHTRVEGFARDYVVSPGLLWVRGYADAPLESPPPVGVEGSE